MKTTPGVDYAQVDGNDPPLVGASPARFAIVRASYCAWSPGHHAWSILSDRAFQRDWGTLRKWGLVRGAYMFPVVQASGTALEQVEVFAHAIKQAGGLEPHIDLPPVLDIEFAKGIIATGKDRKACLAWMRDAVKRMQVAFGCLPMLYTSARVFDGEDEDSLDADHEPLPDLADCPLWLARYPFKTREPAHVAERDQLAVPPVPKMLGDRTDVWIHQYQGDALGFPGFSATVDLNRFFPLDKTSPSGDRVRWVQKKLGLVEDGVWGPVTEQAVRDLQTKHRLVVDSVIGLRTFAALAWM